MGPAGLWLGSVGVIFESLSEDSEEHSRFWTLQRDCCDVCFGTRQEGENLGGRWPGDPKVEREGQVVMLCLARKCLSFPPLTKLSIFFFFSSGAHTLTLNKIVPHICNLLGDPNSQVSAFWVRKKQMSQIMAMHFGALGTPDRWVELSVSAWSRIDHWLRCCKLAFLRCPVMCASHSVSPTEGELSQSCYSQTLFL